MASTPRQVLQRQTVIYPAFTLIILLAVWIYWAITPASASGTGIVDMPASARFAIAVIVTILAPIGLVMKLYKTWTLLSRGQMGEARFVKFGSSTGKSAQLVTFEYVVNGQTYKATKATAVEVAERFTPKTKVPVIFDATKPSRSQLFPYSNIQISEPPIREAAVVAVNSIAFKIVIVALALLQWIIAIVAIRMVDENYDAQVYGPAVLGVLALTIFEIQLYDRWTDKATAAYQARTKFANRLILPLAIAAVLWTAWAMQSESAQFAHERQQAAQSEKDRADSGQRERDFSASMQKLQQATVNRTPAKSTTP